MGDSYATPAPPPKQTFAILLVIVFIDMVGFGIVIPFLPFWAEHFEASPASVALLFATFPAVALFFSFFWGWMSDRWGRRPVLLVSLMGSVGSLAWMGAANALWMLFAARALTGAFGAVVPVAQAYVADITAPEERAKGMGFVGAAMGLGFVFGPAMGSLLAGPDAANPDFRTPFFVAAAVALTGFVVGMLFLSEPAHHQITPLPAGVTGLRQRVRSFAVVMGHPSVALPIAIAMVLWFAMGGLDSTFALWAERAHSWGPREIGLFFTFVGIVMAMTQGLLVGAVSARLGETRTLPIAILVMSLGMATLPWAETWVRVLASAGTIALGFGLATPMTNSLISRNTPDGIQGAVLGASQSSQGLSRIFGPVVAGVLFETYGRDVPYYFGGAILLAVAFAAIAGAARLSFQRA